MRAATLLWALLAAGAGTSLFMLKYEVQAQEQRLSSLRKDIVETQESIHVLKAEWSYLNDPARLREQAERHLGLHPLKPSQIVTIASLPMAEPKAEGPMAEAPQASKIAPVASPPPMIEPRKAPDRKDRVEQPARPTPQPQMPLPQMKAPARTMTASAGQTVKPPAVPAKPAAPAPSVRPEAKPRTAVAAAKPAARPAPVAQAIPAAAPARAPAPVAKAARGESYPAYASTPTPARGPAAPHVTTSGNGTLVITSPALSEPEMASTGARP